MILIHELCQVNPHLLDEKETRAQLPRTGLPLKWHRVNFLIIFIRNLLDAFILQITPSPKPIFYWLLHNEQIFLRQLLEQII